MYRLGFTSTFPHNASQQSLEGGCEFAALNQWVGKNSCVGEHMMEALEGVMKLICWFLHLKYNKVKSRNIFYQSQKTFFDMCEVGLRK